MPAPVSEAEKEQEVVDFKCPRCQATTAYSAANGGLTCTHCGYYEPPPTEIVGKGAEEFEFTVETLQQAAHGWGVERKELQCQSCGIYTSVPPDELTHTCPFCGSNRVIRRKSAQDMLRPRFLIPFKIEAEACQQQARDWLSSSWMTPGSLSRLARVAHFTGIYIPFWTFDAVTPADWEAEVGHTKTERYYANGEWHTRTVTVWSWESGEVNLRHDDVLVEGTSRLSEILLTRLKNYNIGDLVAYRPDYLAGFQAQAYDIPLAEAWEKGRHHIRETTRLACRNQASSSQIRNFSMNLNFEEESWRYTLLPVYIAAYTYNGQTYQVMVNGQTGQVAGQRPVAWWKVWLAVAGLLLPGLIVGLVGLVMILMGGIGIPIGILGLILLFVGVVFAVQLVQHAMEMDDI